MAAGDVTWFNSAKRGLGLKLHDLSGDTIKFAIIKDPTGTFGLSAGTADPRWGAGGTTNVSTVEVTATGAYSAPITLANKTWVESGGTVTFDHDDVSIGGNVSNTNIARYGIYYNDSAAQKNCLAFVDFGATLNISAGFRWQPAVTGVMTIT